MLSISGSCNAVIYLSPKVINGVLKILFMTFGFRQNMRKPQVSFPHSRFIHKITISSYEFLYIYQRMTNSDFFLF